MEAVKISETWYRETMPIMKSYYEDFDIIIPKDADILDDLRSIQINNRGVPRIPDAKTDDKKERHGDSAIACCMMVAASKMEGGEIDYTPLPDKNDRWNENARDADDLTYNQSGCF